MRKTGVLFDLDGTLLDTLQDLADATNYALGQHGLPERSYEQVRSFVGNGARVLMAKASGHQGDTDALLATFRGYYDTHCREKTGPYEGILEMLREVSARFPVAIVSNKPDAAVKTLCAEFFPGIFALGESPDCPRKPAGDMVFKAMEAIGVESCIYVGDSEVDILTAKNAGVACVSVLWGFRDRQELLEAGGNIFCEEPGEILKTLTFLTAGL